jgi:hypothetical protein
MARAGVRWISCSYLSENSLNQSKRLVLTLYRHQFCVTLFDWSGKYEIRYRELNKSQLSKLKKTNKQTNKNTHPPKKNKTKKKTTKKPQYQ